MRHVRRISRSRPKCRVDSARPVGHAVPVTERDLKRSRLRSGVLSARERLQVTQEQFATRAGLSLKTVQRVELATATPRAHTFVGLDTGAGWEPGSARALYETGQEPILAAGPWTPVLTDEQIIAMDSHALADHYIRTEREYGSAAAEDWLFHAMVVRRDARRAAGHTMAADGS